MIKHNGSSILECGQRADAYFCASPSSLRLEMKTGSNGSSLPEIVMPSGPANLGSSTVYVISRVGSGSSAHRTTRSLHNENCQPLFHTSILQLLVTYRNVQN